MKIVKATVILKNNIYLVLILVTFIGNASVCENISPIKERISSDSLSVISTNPKFTKKFNSLVSRAYFKLIVEAERADIRLVNEYKRLYAKNEDKMDEIGIQEEFSLVYRRFLTHRRMLSGLKSWKVFSENRTGDMEYFKRENKSEVYVMYRKKTKDETIIAFLMYRLADLYHRSE